MPADRKQKIAELFIRAQQAKDRAWKCHIGAKHRSALEQAALMEMAAMELRTLLDAENDDAVRRG